MHLISKLENNFFAIGRYWGGFNSGIINAQSIQAMNTGIKAADLNWVWNEQPLTSDSAKQIVRIKNYYKKLTLPFWWWVYPSGQSSTISEMFAAQNIKLFTAIPCMAIDLSALIIKQEAACKIAVSLVKSKADLSLWEKISFIGFEMDIETKKQYHNFISSFDMSGKSPQKLFIAHFEGAPVASALLFFYQDTVGIYFVSTLPAYRHRGIGLAVTRAAMHYAQQSGFKYCILQSSDSGLNVYKQAGFKEFCRADIYSL